MHRSDSDVLTDIISLVQAVDLPVRIVDNDKWESIAYGRIRELLIRDEKYTTTAVVQEDCLSTGRTPTRLLDWDAADRLYPIDARD